MFNLYEIVYWVTGFLVVIALYNITIAFSNKEPRNKNRDYTIMVGYYGISILIHYFVNFPIANLLLTLSFLSALCWSIGISLKRSLAVIVYAIVIMAGIEVIVGIATGYTSTSIITITEYNSIFGRMASAILSYSVATTMRKYKNVNKDIEIPIGYWIMLIGYPFLSIFLLLLVFTYSELHKNLVMMGASIILGMNVLLFTLYDRIVQLYDKKLQDIAIYNLNSSYQQQLELMKTSVAETMTYKHDFNKHMASLNGILAKGDLEKAKEYLERFNGELVETQMLSQTGNLIVDSVVNFAFNTSPLHMNQVAYKAISIPTNMNIEDYDLTIVLSNLLSNAFGAVEQTDHGRVDIFLDYNRGTFLVKIINSYKGELRYEGKKYMTTKANPKEHGYGLKNIQQVVNKYNGQLNLQHNEDEFTVDVMLYDVPTSIQ